MRVIDPEFQARLDGGATNMCRCWLITRKDDMKLGFTDHDLDLAFDGVTYWAGSGLNAGAIQTSTGLSVDNAHAKGALTSDGITVGDIAAGRFDHAEVRQWLVDWQNPALRVLLFRGYLGEIVHGPTAFEAELRGLADALNQPLGRAYLRNCDAVLGDSRCGIDLNSTTNSIDVALSSVTSGILEFAEVAGFAAGCFASGTAEWLNGPNQGHRAVVKTDDSKTGVRLIELWHQQPFAAGVGDIVKLRVGCDKLANTCKAKFNNFNNFRGFPHMPGEDWIVSYPAKGDKLDGGSMYRG